MKIEITFGCEYCSIHIIIKCDSTFDDENLNLIAGKNEIEFILE